MPNLMYLSRDLGFEFVSLLSSNQALELQKNFGLEIPLPGSTIRFIVGEMQKTEEMDLGQRFRRAWNLVRSKSLAISWGEIVNSISLHRDIHSRYTKYVYVNGKVTWFVDHDQKPWSGDLFLSHYPIVREPQIIMLSFTPSWSPNTTVHGPYACPAVLLLRCIGQWSTAIRKGHGVIGQADVVAVFREKRGS